VLEIPHPDPIGLATPVRRLTVPEQKNTQLEPVFLFVADS